MNANELKILNEKIRQFCTDRDWDQFHSIKDLAIGAVTESSELLELFRFKSSDDCEQMFSDEKAREKIEDEIADVTFFLLRIADRYKIDLLKVTERKLEKNAVKYPVAKARGSNRKYDEF